MAVLHLRSVLLDSPRSLEREWLSGLGWSGVVLWRRQQCCPLQDCREFTGLGYSILLEWPEVVLQG
jgi:hypothetical protein